MTDKNDHPHKIHRTKKPGSSLPGPYYSTLTLNYFTERSTTLKSPALLLFRFSVSLPLDMVKK